MQTWCARGGGISRQGGRNGLSALVWPHIPLGKSLPLSAVRSLCQGLPLFGPAWARTQAYSRHHACLAHCCNPCTLLLVGSSLPLFVFSFSSPTSPSHLAFPTWPRVHPYPRWSE